MSTISATLGPPGWIQNTDFSIGLEIISNSQRSSPAPRFRNLIWKKLHLFRPIIIHLTTLIPLLRRKTDLSLHVFVYAGSAGGTTHAVGWEQRLLEELGKLRRIRAAEVEIPRLHLDRHCSKCWTDRKGWLPFQFLISNEAVKLNRYNNHSEFIFMRFMSLTWWSLAKKNSSILKIYPSPSPIHSLILKRSCLLWHLPTVVKDLHIFNLQLQAICISSNVFQGIGQLMKLIIVLQIQGAPILVPSCPWKSRCQACHILTYSNMYADHMSCCCWYHSCFAGFFFLERFNEKNGDQNQRKSGTEIRSQDQKILFRPIGSLMSSITTLHHIQHLLQRFSGRLQQCHTQIHSVFLLAISSIAGQWHIHRIWKRFVSTSQGCRSFEVFQFIDIVNDKEVNV